MSYFVTGATGFIGRHLVERLLDTREGDIFVLVREGSRDAGGPHRAPGAPDRVGSVIGDLGEALLGVDEAWIEQHRGKIDHFFHLAAIYDMTADDESNEVLNVGGTRHAVALGERARGRDLPPRLLGRRGRRLQGPLPRGHVRRGPGAALGLPPHEVRVREDRARGAKVPWRVYRPAIVVGHSRTGPDGQDRRPLLLLQGDPEGARRRCPEWFPLVGPELGRHERRARSTTSPTPWTTSPTSPTSTARRSTWSTREIAALRRDAQRLRAGRARPAARPARRQAADRRPAQGRLLDAHEAARRSRTSARRSWPTSASPTRSSSTSASAPSSTPATPSGRWPARASRCPTLDEYACSLWDYWERHLDPDLFQRPVLRGRVNGQDRRHHRRLERDRPGRRAQDRGGGRDPGPRRARLDKLEETKAEIEAAGGTAYVYAADLSDLDAIDGLVETPAGRPRPRSTSSSTTPGARSAARSSLSLDRFHDFERTMQLNYFGAIQLVMGLLPHCEERGCGHVVNVSSIGVQTNPPRFWPTSPRRPRSTPGRASSPPSSIGDGITFTTIHMPLVRTPMIAPTKMYDSFPTITPDEAARPRVRGDPLEAEADQHRASAPSARSPTRSRRRPSTRSCTWPTRCSPTPPRPRARRTPTRRRRWSRSRWPT